MAQHQDLRSLDGKVPAFVGEPCLEMVEIGARRFRARIPGPMSTALPRASLPRPRVGVEEARLSWRVGVARNLRQLGPHAVEHGDDGPCRSEVGVLVYDRSEEHTSELQSLMRHS